MNSSNLNFEDIEKKLSRSSVRKRVVTHIAGMETGTLFFGQEISIQLQVNAHSHLTFLEELGLVSRLPGHKQPFPTQLEKTDSEDWAEVQEIALRDRENN